MSAKAIRFIGNYDVCAEGKFLWEILTQLRGLGVGRLVTKTEWSRKWPEQPSYLKIVRARPEMDRWLDRGKLWAEFTFRGRNLGIYEFGTELNRSDWQLIHKHEEQKYTEVKDTMKDITLPNSFPVPPLQVLLAKKYAKKSGIEWNPAQERAPLKLAIDPEFELLAPFIKQAEPAKTGKTIYDEVNPQDFLDLYGAELPAKVEPWNAGPAHFVPRFTPETLPKPA
uniref:28S ribosomal protein S34, mitochondrial n=1 Tax=Steinernema glaseri TaxID=37863 RepID=A0A1I7YJ18_9BILA